jgi:hypothetical protein
MLSSWWFPDAYGFNACMYRQQQKRSVANASLKSSSSFLRSLTSVLSGKADLAAARAGI